MIANPQSIHRYSLRVYYEDTDAGGVVYHANYLRYAERGRTEALRDAGIPHAEMVERFGLMFMVHRAEIDYQRPAMLDEKHFADPLRYDPYRWTRRHERDGEGGAHDVRAWLQFGAGPRVCPGRHLATVEMRLALSMLMKEFTVELAIDPAQIKEVQQFTMVPDTMPVRLRPRAARAT